MKKILFLLTVLNIAQAEAPPDAKNIIRGSSRNGTAFEELPPRKNSYSDDFFTKNVHKGYIQESTTSPSKNNVTALENIKDHTVDENLKRIAAGNNLLINYGVKNPQWLKKWHELTDGKYRKIHILQLGDSHTAADYFSNSVRTTLQMKYGNAGLGLVPPLAFKMQRVINVNYEQKNWAQATSRNSSDIAPVGGLKAISGDNGRLMLSLQNDFTADQVTFSVLAAGAYSTLSVKDKNGYTQTVHVSSNTVPEMWHYKTFKASPPLTISASKGVQLGAIHFENGKKGIIYSALGINGAQISEISKWHLSDIENVKPDLIILAYGTNEAASKTFDNIENYWRNAIHELKLYAPQAGIVVLGAPESVRDFNGECGSRLPHLDLMQELQQKLASEEKVLFWSWQEALGGACQIKNLQKQNLISSDGIHFTAEGYQFAGKKFADALIEFINTTKNVHK